MHTNDLMNTIVWRAGTVNRNDPNRHKMIAEAVKILKQTYVIERRSISIHIPLEDEYYQKKHGGSKVSPVLVGLMNPEGKPLLIPKDMTLKIFRRLSEFVVPFFTSDNRALTFIKTIEAKGCIVPPCIMKHVIAERPLVHWIEQGNGVVNPIPEFVLTAFIALEMEKDELKVITVIAHDPDISGENSNPLDDFFKNR